MSSVNQPTTAGFCLRGLIGWLAAMAVCRRARHGVAGGAQRSSSCKHFTFSLWVRRSLIFTTCISFFLLVLFPPHFCWTLFFGSFFLLSSKCQHETLIFSQSVSVLRDVNGNKKAPSRGTPKHNRLSPRTLCLRPEWGSFLGRVSRGNMHTQKSQLLLGKPSNEVILMGSWRHYALQRIVLPALSAVLHTATITHFNTVLLFRGTLTRPPRAF